MDQKELFLFSPEVTMNYCNINEPSFVYDKTTVAYIQYLFSALDHAMNVFVGSKCSDVEQIQKASVLLEIHTDAVDIFSFHLFVLKTILSCFKKTIPRHVLIIYPWDALFSLKTNFNTFLIFINEDQETPLPNK